MQQNGNDCFHYFLYIIEKNEFKDIRNVLASQSVLEAAREEIREQSDLKLAHNVEKVTDDAKDDPIELRLKVKGRHAARVERDLFKHFESSDPGPWQSIMVYGHMDIENVFSGSCLMPRKTIN